MKQNARTAHYAPQLVTAACLALAVLVPASQAQEKFPSSRSRS